MSCNGGCWAETKMGVTGVELIKLLQMVCYDFPADIVETLLKVPPSPPCGPDQTTTPE